MNKTKAREALEFVRREAKQCDTATDLHNKFFGNGGRFGQLFPTREEREEFMKTPEYLKIVEIRESLPEIPPLPRRQRRTRVKQ